MLASGISCLRDFRNLRPGRHERSGVAAVEFAIVASVIFLFIWVSLEFLWFSMLQNLADTASYEAARHIMVPGATLKEGRDLAESRIGALTRKGQAFARAFDKSGASQTEINDLTARVVVVVRIPLRHNVPMISQFLSKNHRVYSRTTMTFESYSGFYDGNAY